MTNEEYLKIFHNIEKSNNLNETHQQEQWESLNETPDVSQYKIDENLNGGWGTEDFQIESRINGIKQQSYNNPYQQQRKPKKSQNLNGLDQFIDEEDNLNEVIKHSEVNTDFNENIAEQDVVTVEMFERMNNNGLISLHQKLFR